MHLKKFNPLTKQQEIQNIKIVEKFGFSLPYLFISNEGIFSTQGLDVCSLVKCLTENDARKVLITVFKVLKRMHALGFYHLDARLSNFVVSDVPKDNAVKCPAFDEPVYSKPLFCYAIDYETLWTSPDRCNINVKEFDENALSLSKYGFKSFDHYLNSCTAYRYDVHTVVESFIRDNESNESFKGILKDCAKIRNHDPDVVTGEFNSTTGVKPYEYTQYLLSDKIDVMNIDSAIQLLSGA